MLSSVIIDLLSVVFVSIALVLLWHEKNRFVSLRPLLPAFTLIGLGRVCDILLEHPGLHLDALAGVSAQTLGLWLALAGNITDAAGFALVIYGFIKIIKHHQDAARQIHQLETLLPLCANCKRYRTPENQWLPIEKYLIEMGTAKLTHGICPECATKFFEDYHKKDKE